MAKQLTLNAFIRFLKNNDALKKYLRNIKKQKPLSFKQNKKLMYLNIMCQNYGTNILDRSLLWSYTFEGREFWKRLNELLHKMYG